ncbi:HAD-IA family hydrolase [uncultured Litoreibacter sp.]|uniref:HAD-IA family hydrolase n=1 Tax=uncultured Litoreibacter sp. TaxID=1392394 RepID=UPI0026214457|nr:HAD-IA family hydrolase [uncultured Litoreibacter sp.]
MAELKLVVFDVDGTLIDSLAHIKGAMKTAFDACGHTPPDEAAVRSIIGLSLPEAMRKLDPSLDDAGIRQVVEAYKDSFNRSETTEVRQDAPMFAGARAALEQLHAQDELLLGVATGKSRRGLVRMMGVHALEGYFVTTQVADDHPSKPHPSMLEQCLYETGVKAKNALIIGDTSFDMEMGRNAGFGTIGAKWGYHPDEALAPFTDVMIDDFAALGGAISDLLGARQ